jgi:leucyl-tRNA synthetase
VYFSVRRVIGRAFPVYYVNVCHKMIDAQHLPIILPEVKSIYYRRRGLPPLGNAAVWAWDNS